MTGTERDDDDWKGEAKLRGIRAPVREGSGHHFGKSGLSKKAKGLTDRAPVHIFRDNMRGEKQT